MVIHYSDNFPKVIPCRVYTLYAKSLPLEITCRIWDVFFRDGEEFVFQAALGKAVPCETISKKPFQVCSECTRRLF